MTPEEKAIELVEKFITMQLSPEDDICVTINVMSKEVAKQCALICVHELIMELKEEGNSFCRYLFYHEVKNKIEKI